MMKPTSISTLIGLVLYTATTTAQASDSKQALQLMELSLQDLMNVSVTTASRQAESKDATPAHIMVVTRQQIRDRRYKNLADLLEDLPGVDFQRGTKSSQYNQFTMQGNLGPNRLLVLMDGVRIAHPSGGNYPIAENLSLYMAKQVEVLYGPAAALYGADAVSGVINIITEAGNKKDGSWISIGAGSFASKEASFMAGINTKNNIRIALGGHWQQSDMARLDKEYPSYYRKVDNEKGDEDASRENYIGDIKSHSFFARADLKDRFTFGYYRNHFTNLTSVADHYQTTKYDKNAFWATTTDTIYGKYKYKIGNDIDAQLIADYSIMQVDPASGYNGYYTDYELKYGYARAERLAIEQNINWRINKQHQLQAGIGAQKYYNIDADAMPHKYDYSKSPSKQNMYYDPNKRYPMQLFDLDYHNFSVYTQLQTKWTAQFSTSAGLRFDHHSIYGNTVNPRLGAVYKLNEQHIFKALYGEAFRAPSSEEMLRTYGSIDDTDKANGFHLPNTNLQPEKVRTLGLVWDWRPTQDVNLVANLFASETEKLIASQYYTNNLSNYIPGVDIQGYGINENTGNQRHYGIDLYGQWKHKLSSNWTADYWASASWIKGEVEDRSVDRQISYVADYKLKLGSTFRYQDKFTITPKIRWTDDVTNRQIKGTTTYNIPVNCTSEKSAPSRCKTPGYLVADLHLGWHQLFDGHASIWLDVYNLTDNRYTAAGSGSTSFWDMPQQPRTIMLSADWKF